MPSQCPSIAEIASSTVRRPSLRTQSLHTQRAPASKRLRLLALLAVHQPDIAQTLRLPLPVPDQ